MTTKILPEDQKIAQEVAEKLNRSGSTATTIGFVVGAFGDMEECEGLLEKVLTPSEGGTFMKFYGCTYLFKGFPVTDFVENLSLAKALISFLPREILFKNFLFSSSIFLLFVFARTKFLYYLNLYFGMIYDRTVVKAGMNEIRYNAPAKELRRATEVVLRRRINPERPFTDYGALEIGNNKEMLFYVFIAKALYFSYFFMEHDNAYRFRFQDVIEQVDKKRVKENVVREIKRLLEILQKREQDLSVKRKWMFLTRIIIPVLYFSLKLRDLIKDFLLEVDIDKVKLDESDWYFCLRRKTYMFRDIPIEKRLEEKVGIDKEKNHTIVKFLYKDQLQPLKWGKGLAKKMMKEII